MVYGQEIQTDLPSDKFVRRPTSHSTDPRQRASHHRCMIFSVLFVAWSRQVNSSVGRPRIEKMLQALCLGIRLLKVAARPTTGTIATLLDPFWMLTFAIIVLSVVLFGSVGQKPSERALLHLTVNDSITLDEAACDAPSSPDCKILRHPDTPATSTNAAQHRSAADPLTCTVHTQR